MSDSNLLEILGEAIGSNDPIQIGTAIKCYIQILRCNSAANKKY